jgi:8-oxo-dGTP pyrophosphatase MutT (NUDIX family)
MSRPVPTQVVPRPATWQPGEAAPWDVLSPAERSGITVGRVLAGLSAHGQRGPVPDDIGSAQEPVFSDGAGESAVPSTHTINAAVLAVVFEEAGEARLILTRRASSLRSHAGQVSFPGGRLDPGEDAPTAAVREAYEEIALNPAQVSLEGWIHPVFTLVSASLIMPLVATVPSRPDVVASPAEVERVLSVPLRDLADPSIFHEERWSFPGRQTGEAPVTSRSPGNPAGPDDSFPVWFFEVEGELIWGATARMIHELLQVVLLPGAA